MSQTASSIKQQKYDGSVARVDMKLEVQLLSVTDVDRAKEFYTKLGWWLDADIVGGNDFRVRPVHPTGLRILDFVRQGTNDGRARFNSRRPDRFRHRGGPEGSRCQGCRCE